MTMSALPVQRSTGVCLVFWFEPRVFVDLFLGRGVGPEVLEERTGGQGTDRFSRIQWTRETQVFVDLFLTLTVEDFVDLFLARGVGPELQDGEVGSRVRASVVSSRAWARESGTVHPSD